MDNRLREGIAGSEAEGRAERADQQPFAEQRRDQRPPRHAERAQERQLGAAPDDRERLGGEHEQPAREQRHQCEHVQVHPIGPRNAGAAFDTCLGPLDPNAGGHLGGEARAQRADVDPRSHAQIDAVQPAEAFEGRLHPGDVGERHAPLAAAHDAGDAERRLAERDLEPQAIAGRHPQPFGGRRAKEDRVGPQRIEGVGGVGRDQLGLHQRGAENVEPEHPEAFAPADHARVDLDHRARDRDLGRTGDARVFALVEARARADDLEVGGAGERLHRLRELVDRRLVDELHREAERDAERDRREREDEAPLALPERAGEERQGERGARHGFTPAAGPRRSGRARGPRSARRRASA